MDYDFIVVGAGPAGSTFARQISPKYKVLVVETRRLDLPDDFRHSKTCGGLLNPSAQKELSLLNVSVPYHVLRGPQMFTVRAVDLENKISSHYQKHYLNIDREMFDRYIFSLIPKNVDRILGARYKSHKRIDGGVEVVISIAGKPRTLTCRRIIAADGASSKLRRSFCPEIRLPKVYACPQAHFKTKTRLNYMFAVFDNSISDYYSWGIQKEDTLVVGSAIDDTKNANLKFSILIDKLSDLGLDLSNQIKREGALLFKPSSQKDIFLGNNPVHFIGEAAGFISPSSSEGVSFALKSGRLLAEAINKSYAGFEIEYAKNCKTMMFKIFYKIYQSKIMYNSFCRNKIIKSGALSLKRHEKNLKF